MLSLRGWGREEFDTVTPDFLAAARWTVRTERMMPLYREAESILGQSLTGLDPASALTVAKGKIAAQAMVADWRPALFPEDDDG